MRSLSCIKGVIDHLAAAHHDIDPTLRAEIVEKRNQYENNKVLKKCQRLHNIHHPHCAQECADMQLSTDE